MNAIDSTRTQPIGKAATHQLYSSAKHVWYVPIRTVAWSAGGQVYSVKFYITRPVLGRTAAGEVVVKGHSVQFVQPGLY